MFSSAGIGCYGFKLNGFECVATCELHESRMAIQRANRKCRYDSGYVCGDISRPETHARLLAEMEMWKEKEGLGRVDAVFATPPCQGMSAANGKKNDHEQVRNSLIVEAIRLIGEIRPKVFVFENVQAFMKSVCTDVSGEDMTIEESITRNLSENYRIYWKVINFKDYGVPSSRIRIIVVGTDRNLVHTTPLQIFPKRRKEITLRESIGGFTPLGFGERDKADPLHFARPFPEYMLEWIRDLGEGESAFDNPEGLRPYRIMPDGRRTENRNAFGGKYTRLRWDCPGGCVTTRNDIMSSQRTIHPCDNRVLSIRELMRLMTVPDSFRWTESDDALTVENSAEYLSKNERTIRICLGEAVPTRIMEDMSRRIGECLAYEDFLADGAPMGENLYSVGHRMFGELLPVPAFDEMMSLPADACEVKVGIDGGANAINCIPQVSGYYSHADSIVVDVAPCEGIGDIVRLIEPCSNLEVRVRPLRRDGYDLTVGVRRPALF